MKLRPTKEDRKALDALKTATGETTYSKAIMKAARQYPVHLKNIKDLEEELYKANDMIQVYEDSAGFLLDGLEALRRIARPKSKK